MPHSTSKDSVQRQLPIKKGIHLESFLANIVITWDCFQLISICKVHKSKQGYKVLVRSRFTHVDYILIMKVPPQQPYRICNCFFILGVYAGPGGSEQVVGWNC